MFVRFVTLNKNEDSHCLAGVFQEAYRLWDQGRFGKEEARQFKALLQWFHHRLPVPNRFSRSGGRQAHRQGICWFKADAVEHLGKIRELVALLEQCGVSIRRLWTRRPGYVVYEDSFQVTAIPFRDTTA
jgi:hypothetical protein